MRSCSPNSGKCPSEQIVTMQNRMQDCALKCPQKATPSLAEMAPL